MSRVTVDAATFRRFDEAYSADTIAEKSSLKAVVVFKGALWTTVGKTTGPKIRTVITAYRLYPRTDWPFSTKPRSYQERVNSRVRGERFYYGVRVKHGRTVYVMGPERIEIRNRDLEAL